MAEAPLPKQVAFWAAATVREIGETPLPPPLPKQRVQIYMEGDFSLLSPDRQAAAIDAFAAVMGISAQQIEVYRVYPGSIVFELGAPPEGVERLREILISGSRQFSHLETEETSSERETAEGEGIQTSLQSSSPQLLSLNIEKVIIERLSGEVETWLVKDIQQEETSQWFKSILEKMFSNYEQFQVEKEFGAGFSSSLLLLVRAFRNGHPLSPVLVKVGPAALIQKEFESYRTYIQGKWIYAFNLDAPILTSDGNWGGFFYFVVSGRPLWFESLYSYLDEADVDPETIGDVLSKLFRSAGGWRRVFSSAVPDLSISRSYDFLLPTNLTIQAADLPPDISPRLLNPDTANDQPFSAGEYVQLEGFVVVEVDPVGESMTLDLPVPPDALLPAGHQHPSYRLKLFVERPQQYQIDDTISRLTGVIIATRSQLLENFAQGALGSGVALGREILTLSKGIALPNPLLTLPDVLNQSRPARLGHIHGDLNLENILVDQEGHLIGLIDFANARQDHILHDLLRLETDVIVRLIPQILKQADLSPEIIYNFYEQLHTATFAAGNVRPILPHPNLEKPFIILKAIRQEALRYLAHPDDYTEYYNGLTIYLVGALRFANLDNSAKQTAFWGAATVRQLILSVPISELRPGLSGGTAAEQKEAPPMLWKMFSSRRSSVTILITALFLMIVILGLIFRFSPASPTPTTEVVANGSPTFTPSVTPSVTRIISSLPETTEPPPTAQAVDKSTVARIFEEGKIRIGVKENFPPFGFRDQDGELTGFDIDVAKEFGRRWFDDEEAVEIVPVTADDAIVLLLAEEVDLLVAAIVHTQERDQHIDFSQTYFVDGQGLLVPKGSDIKNIVDLNGKFVAVTSGSIAALSNCTLPNIDVECHLFTNQDQVLDALLQQEEVVQAFVSDSVTLAEIARDFPEEVELVTERLTGEIYTFTDEPYAIGLRPGDSQLQGLVNVTLQAMKQDGMYDALHTKWFAERTPHPISILPGELAIAEVPELTREYSKIELINIRNRVLVAGVQCDLTPFGLKVGRDIVGFDVDLIEAMADAWGVKVKFVCVTSANRIEKLLDNEIDLIAASMTHTWPRSESIAFSQTYFSDGQSLLVHWNSGITGLPDLRGRTIGALKGSTSIINIEEAAGAADIVIDIEAYDTAEDAIADLNSGQIDAFTSDSVILSEFAADSEDETLVVVGGLLSEEPYGLGLPQNDEHFIDLVNCTLQELKANGTYNRIYTDWIGENATPYPIEIFPGERDCDFDTTLAQLETVPSKVDNIRDGRSLRVGVQIDFAPFEFEEAGELTGMDVDLAEALAGRWFEGDLTKLELVPLTAEERIPALVNGEVDLLLAALTHRTERGERIDFSQTYFVDGQSLLVREGEGIDNLADLDGKIVAALLGSTSLDNFEEVGRTVGIGATLMTYTTSEEAVEALQTGGVDAFTSDNIALKQIARQNPELAVGGGQFSSEPYGIGLPQFDRRFQNLVNFTLQEMKRDGTYDAIYCRWFPDDYDPYELELWPDGEAREPEGTYDGVNIERPDSEPVENQCLEETEPVAEENPEITTANAELYEVAAGDTLSTIAEEFYGDILEWRKIYDDNRDIIGDDPGRLEVGMELRIRK